MLDGAIKVLKPMANLGNGFMQDFYGMTGGALGLAASGLDYVKAGGREGIRDMSNSFLDAADERGAMIDKDSYMGKAGGLAGYAMGGAKLATSAVNMARKHNVAKMLGWSTGQSSAARRAARQKVSKIVRPAGATAGVTAEGTRDRIYEYGASK